MLALRSCLDVQIFTPKWEEKNQTLKKTPRTNVNIPDGVRNEASSSSERYWARGDVCWAGFFSGGFRLRPEGSTSNSEL